MSSIPLPPNPFLAEGGVWQLPRLAEIFFLPGDWALYGLASYTPAVAAALGLDSADYGGAYAGFLAFWFWLMFSLALIAVAAFVRDVNRALTNGVRSVYRDVLYRLRMWRVLVTYRRRAPSRVEPTLE